MIILSELKEIKLRQGDTEVYSIMEDKERILKVAGSILHQFTHYE